MTLPLSALTVLRADAAELVTLDFETFYDTEYTLKKLTTEGYVRDFRFETIGVGVKVGGASTCWMEEAEFREWVRRRDWKTTAVLAHHAHFDGLILSHHFGATPGFWFDTVSMGRVLHHALEVGGSLAKLAEHYKVGQKGHEVVLAMGKRRKDFTEAEWLQYGAYCRNDCDLTFAIFHKMVQAFPELEAYTIDATIRMFTEPALVVDTHKLEAALRDELKRKDDLLKQAAADKDTLMSNERFAVLLAAFGVDPPRKVSPKTEKETWAFAKSDPGMKDLLEHENDAVRWLTEARVGVKSTLGESRIQRFLSMGARGKAAVYLKYAAAHTQRWGGADKTNFQNLPRGGVLRDSLVAPEGHVVVAVDSGQIEARGLAWLAGNHELLDAFRANRDVYSEFASEAYGRPVDRRNNPDDKIPGFVGKVCVLGLGYGMGWRKFAQTLLAGAMGGPPVQFGQDIADALFVDVANFRAKNRERIEEIPSRLQYDDLSVHCAVAERFVSRYRRVNASVPELWKYMDYVIQAMDGDLGGTFGPGEIFSVARHSITRPTGLKLRYPGLEDRHGDGYSYLGGRMGKERTKVYGGSLTENLVQAFCRDIVTEQMLYLYGAYGYRPVTMTHDEVVFVVPEAEAEQALAQSIEVMRRPPDWCPDLPLNAEGGFGKTYGDAK